MFIGYAIFEATLGFIYLRYLKQEGIIGRNKSQEELDQEEAEKEINLNDDPNTRDDIKVTPN